MTSPNLSDAEKKYLETLRDLPTTVSSRLIGWAMELLPSIALFGWGLFKSSTFFLVAGFLSLLYFSVWHMYQQLRGIRLIRSIYRKQLAQIAPQDP